MKLDKNLLRILALVLILLGARGADIFSGKTERDDAETTAYQVVRVVDGDTIIVNIAGQEERVRMIGVDTPESVHPDAERNVPYGKIAADFTKSKLEGKYVTLRKDVSDRDKYGRLLRYVYIDDEFFNETLVRQGHAVAKAYPPDTAKNDVLVAAQAAAQKEKKGMWAEYPGDIAPDTNPQRP